MASREEPTPDAPDAASNEEAALERALSETPKGAIAVAGTAVALLMICWFAIYLFVFLPLALLRQKRSEGAS